MSTYPAVTLSPNEGLAAEKACKNRARGCLLEWHRAYTASELPAGDGPEVVVSEPFLGAPVSFAESQTESQDFYI